MNRPHYRPWIAGDVMSWALGATLGVLAGLILLIVTPGMIRNAVKPASPPAKSTMTGDTTAPSATPATPMATPAPAPASGGTAESGSGDAKAGAPLFASNCAGCHGANAKGGVGPNLLLADGPKAWTDPQFLTALREGKTPERALNAIMPRFTDAQLKDGDVANIHAYLKSLN